MTREPLPQTARPAAQKAAKPAAARDPAPGPLGELSEMAETSAPVQRMAAFQRMADEGRSGQLPAALQRSVESLSGTSLGSVEVHRNSAAPAQVGAEAFAQGGQIHLAPGKDHHLPHEAWHVAQQAQGRVAATAQYAGRAINDDPALEAEADAMGARAADLAATEALEAETPAASNPTPASDGPLQGKFGFEVETRVVTTAANEDRTDLAPDRYVAPDGHLQDYPHLGTGAGFALHLDHIGSFKGDIEGGPIIELVTDPPFDESVESEDDVAAKMQTMADTATALANNATTPKKLGGVANVNAVGPATGWHLFAGAPGVSGQKANGYVQSTMGVKLSAVPQFLEHLATDEMKSSKKDATRMTKSADISRELYATIIQRLHSDVWKRKWKLPEGWSKETEKVPTGNKYFNKTKTKTTYHHDESETDQSARPTEHTKVDYDIRELMGLLALIGNYLIAGKENRGEKEESANLTKNLIGQIFYKTSLATVRNSLRGHSKKVVEDADWRSFLKAELLKKTGVAAGDKLIAIYEGDDDCPTAGAYIDGVLSGSSDWVFTESKNPYSNELVDNVGKTGKQTPAVVVENRRVQPVGGTGAEKGLFAELLKRKQDMEAGMGGKLRAPAEWVTLARQYFQIVDALNSPQPQTPDKYEP